MNIKISYNWIKDYLKTKKDANEFASDLTLRGPSVDSVIKMCPQFENVVVGQIKEIKDHPQADKLKIAIVDIGKKKLNIVCGAPNIEAGQKVPIALVGGKVGDLSIKETKIRGVLSAGMMCSQKELGIGDDHTGIYILPDYVDLGLSLEKVMPIEDSVLDVEVTSNRPDSMSVVGVAREASAILGDKFVYEEPKPNLQNNKNIKLNVSVKEPKICNRYQAVVMTNIKVGASPLWMQQRLLASGMRPINNLVDITNYILLEFGRPMHVFDYDKLKNKEINVRLAKKGEKILALDGKIYELNSDNLVIADSNDPVAIAGVMGGELSGSSSNTKTIVIESANFDPVSVRKTSRLLNLQSDSSLLYEKGLHPEGTNVAILRAIELMTELAGGELASDIKDEKNYKEKETEITLSVDSVSKILATDISEDKIKEILKSLGFKVSGKKSLKVIVPWWRLDDVKYDYDLIEEIARIYGYHKISSVLPSGQLPVDYQDDIFAKEDRVKNVLVAGGFNENLNYSFISEELIKKYGFNVSDHLQIANPLSGDFEYMRTSLLPGLTQSLADNQNYASQIKIFELSKIYKLKENDLPTEALRLAATIADSDFSKAFYRLKGALSLLMDSLYIYDYKMKMTDSHLEYWQPQTVLDVIIQDKLVGQIGIIKREVGYLFGLKKEMVAFELDFDLLAEYIKDAPIYKSAPKYPAITLDLSLEINKKIKYQEIIDEVFNIDNLIKDVVFLSQYYGDDLADDSKALAFSIVYRDDNKTLELAQAQKIHNKIIDNLKKKFEAKQR